MSPVFEPEEEDAPVIPTTQKTVRQCPGCWRAALHSDVTRYVHEIAPCYPECWL